MKCRLCDKECFLWICMDGVYQGVKCDNDHYFHSDEFANWMSRQVDQFVYATMENMDFPEDAMTRAEWRKKMEDSIEGD